MATARRLHRSAHGGSSTPPGDPRLSLPSGSVLPTIEDMGVWGEAEYELESDVGEALGFTLERNAGRTMRVLERYRAVEMTSAAGVPLRIGVAVRMVVRRSGKPSSDGPSLSTLAGRAEAGGDRPAGTVSVLGFAHLEVGELIPGEVDLDIDGYARLLSAVDGIQGRVADNPRQSALRSSPDSNPTPRARRGTVTSPWARPGDSPGWQQGWHAECPALLTDALRSNQRFAEGLSRVYRAVMGPAADGPVTTVHAANAKQRLHALNITGPLTPPRPIPDRPVP